ncbi:MAG: carbohydrate ABC transporter permease [Ardenticatenaceae bacterium]
MQSQPSVVSSQPAPVVAGHPKGQRRFLTHLWRGTWGYAILAALTILFVAPFYWMLVTALKSDTQLFALPPAWTANPPSWENFRRVFQEVPFGRYILNSALLVTLNVVGQLFSTTLVAYGFARLRFPGRGILFLILLATLMIPSQVTLVPQFILFARLGWVNTYLPLVVPAFTGSAFLVFLLRQYMMTIPLDLDEAAIIDGANRWQILWHVILPLSAPALILVMVFTFVDVWNDFMGPLVYLNDPNLFTVSLGLSFFQGARETSWNLLMAGALMSMVPPIVLFFFAQRHLLGGISTVGIKG